MSGFLEHTRRPSSPRWAAGDGPSSSEDTNLAELVATRDRTHAQMMAAWSYWIEAKAAFSIAAGELALAEYGDQP